MEIHHGKHHATYVAKLNAALEKHPGLAATPVEALLKDAGIAARGGRGPRSETTAAGISTTACSGRSWRPAAGGSPTGALAAAIDKAFGGFAAFREQFSTAAANLFGSGWAWLAADGSRKLSVVTTPNQDSPLSQGLVPVLGLDVWEHAYYLNYQNRRPDYIAAFWNVVSWKQVAENLEAVGR